MVSGLLPFRNFAAVGSLGLAFQAKVHGSIQFNNLAGSKKVPDGRRFIIHRPRSLDRCDLFMEITEGLVRGPLVCCRSAISQLDAPVC